MEYPLPPRSLANLYHSYSTLRNIIDIGNSYKVLPWLAKYAACRGVGWMVGTPQRQGR